ncbi:hypothetical protein LZ31DRAFT_66915 [Colletotrichum somersetense]|nr:hypothetical protein LZ31DRAFT_66915 [Colletotrichum somersetense]
MGIHIAFRMRAAILCSLHHHHVVARPRSRRSLAHASHPAAGSVGTPRLLSDCLWSTKTTLGQPSFGPEKSRNTELAVENFVLKDVLLFWERRGNIVCYRYRARVPTRSYPAYPCQLIQTVGMKEKRDITARVCAVLASVKFRRTLICSHTQRSSVCLLALSRPGDACDSLIKTGVSLKLCKTYVGPRGQLSDQ